MNLQPLGDRLLVELLEEEAVTASGIVLPDTAREKPQRGRVVAVGEGKRNETDGERIPLDVTVGDTVFFSKYGGTEIPKSINVGGKEYMLMREADVLAKIVDKPAAKSAKKKG